MNGTSSFEDFVFSRLDAYPLLPPAGRHRASAQVNEASGLCDGTLPLREVLSRTDAASLVPILGEMIWLGEPLSAFVLGAERCLVLSAYPEQAFLSMGGYLIKRRAQLDCLNVVCFSPPAPASDNSSSHYNELRLARRDDAHFCARVAGVRNVMLDLPHQALRARLAIGTDRVAHETSIRTLLGGMIYRLIEAHEPRQVFVPAGVGTSADNRMLFDVAVQLFESGYFRTTRYELYEPVPDAADYIDVDNFLSSFENVYTRLTPWFDDVTGVMPEKPELARALRSCRSDEAGPVIRSVLARNAVLARVPGGTDIERFWNLGLTFGPN
jgi:LmbE family N-acetylglucosaminyl deacetylase